MKTVIAVVASLAISFGIFGAASLSTSPNVRGATATPTVGPPPQFFQFHPDYAPLRSGPIPYGGNGWSPSEAPQP